MKVYLSNYRNHWYSPYTWFDYLFFWTDWSRCHRDRSIASALDEDRKWIDRPEWVERWSDRLVPVSRAIQWTLDLVHPKIDYVKIDRWDTWSMDSTLAQIVLPMLRDLRDSKQGAPYVDPEDVPKHLRPKRQTKKERENGHTDSTHFERWDWVLDEMIFAFEMKVKDDWKDAFHSGEIDILWVPVDKDGNEVPKADAKYHEMRHGPNHTHEIDMEGMRAVQERISNGFKLFGKYYEGLWS
jgi:hypothetical protein